VDKTSFRYTGDNWASPLGHRLYLKDILLLFLDKAKTRKDIKANAKISGSARQHSSYYLRVLHLFEMFMKDKTINQAAKEKTVLKNYVLIIDEINRANLPSVLGELIYGLEYRGEAVESMYEVDGSRSMIIPPNLYVIGTMNTADRSVGHIDYAIRRRFAFVDVLPTIDPIKNELAKEMFEKVSKLFVANYTEVIQSQASPKRASSLLSDFRPEDVWIGHSYFLTSQDGVEGNNEIKIKMKYEVLPLLKEYVKDGILRSSEESSDDPVQMVLEELNGL
jgi:5-methylcytosine-specific restriction endonuclease McrBC GTP-binding regulatory subunit McrB